MFLALVGVAAVVMIVIEAAANREVEVAVAVAVVLQATGVPTVAVVAAVDQGRQHHGNPAVPLVANDIKTNLKRYDRLGFLIL